MRSIYRYNGGLQHLVFGFLLIVLSFSSGAAQQVRVEDAQQKQSAMVVGIPFRVPQGFELERSSNSSVAFMRSREISLFVAVPDKPIDDKYLTQLSDVLTSQLLPQEQGFDWKVQTVGEPQFSKYQTTRGSTQGLNANAYVQTDYVVLKIRGHEVLVGSIGTYGKGLESAHYFKYGGLGYSFTGGSGRFQLIASITGEKLEEE